MEQQNKVGRPKDQYKHISPFSNEPIPAPQYYKEIRALKRQQGAVKGNNQYTIGYKSQILDELIKSRDIIEALIQKEIKLQSITTK